MARVSLVIPAYNCEKYISKALESVDKQTYDDFDVTVVNDGSTDNTLQVVSEIADNFSYKIKVINQENKGAAGARKTGMEATDSDYLAFLDSDDFVNEIYLEELVKTLEEEKVNIAHARFGIHFNVPLIRHIFFRGKKRRNGKIDLQEEKAELPAINTVTNMKLYRRPFFAVTDKNFEANEDVAMTYYLAAKARYIAYADKALYHYVPNENGLVSRKLVGYKYEKIKNTFLPLLELKRLFEQDNLLEIYYEEVASIFIWQITQRITQINKEKIEDKTKTKLIALLINFLDINFPNWENNTYYKQNTSLQLPDILNRILAKNIINSLPARINLSTNEDVFDKYKEIAETEAKIKIKSRY